MQPHRGLRAVVALICIARAGGAAAQAPAPDPHAAQPQRPTVATHAGTVSKGWLEFEAGLERDRWDDGSHGGQAPILAKIGLARRVQLELQAPLVSPPGPVGLGVGDVSVGVKFRLVEDAPVVADLAILPSIKMPTGPSGLGTGTTDIGLLLISSHELGPVAMDLNFGYVRRSGDAASAPQQSTLWTASFGGPAYGALGWVAELYGYPATSGPLGADSTVALLAGPTWKVQRWLVLDTGVIVPIAGSQPRAFYAGLTYNAGRLWR